MFELFLALFMAFACPAHNHSDNKGTDTVIITADTGGDGGTIPPPPPPPPGS